MKHGFLTFGETAKESYDRHVHYVDLAEKFVAQKSKGKKVLVPVPDVPAGNPQTNAAVVGPILRGLLSEATGDADHPWRRMILEYRASDEILAFCLSECWIASIISLLAFISSGSCLVNI